jgi:hypothetical protein
MYTSCVERNDVTSEWIRKTDDFVERAYGEAAKGASLVPCSCTKCANWKRKSKKAMVEHIWKNRFTPDYTRWIFHGEAHRTREEVLRQCVEHYDILGRFIGIFQSIWICSTTSREMLFSPCYEKSFSVS